MNYEFNLLLTMDFIKRYKNYKFIHKFKAQYFFENIQIKNKAEKDTSLLV